jgi:Tol biopolymer transport system component
VRLLALLVGLAVVASGTTIEASYHPPPGDYSPMWSSDGAIAYVSQRAPDGLHVRNLSSGLDRWFDRAPLLDARRASLSPDGRWVAGVTSSSPPSLVVASLDGSDVRRLPATSTASVARSPDSTHIAFTQGGALPSLYTIRIDGSDLRKIAESSLDPAWSPDGSQIAYAHVEGGREDIVVAKPDGSSPRNLTASLDSPHRLPAWSPDGSRIASPGRTFDFVDVLTLEGGSVVQVRTAARADHLSWRRDSQSLVYSASGEADATSGVYQVDVQTGVQELVAASGTDAEYSPDASRIAFSAHADCGSGIYIVSAAGDPPQPVTNNCRTQPPVPTIAASPKPAAYGSPVTLTGRFPPGSETSAVRIVEFPPYHCLGTDPTPIPGSVTRAVIESVDGRWKYRTNLRANTSFNVYSDTAVTGIQVRIAPRLKLRRVGSRTLDVTVSAAAPLGGNRARVERQSKGRWIKVRDVSLKDRSSRGETAISGAAFELGLRPGTRRVLLRDPVVRANVFGCYALGISNTVRI